MVASFTLSHVVAIVLKADTADDVSWLSISWDHESSGGSSQRMLAMIECRVGSSGSKLIGLPMAAMSSVSVSRSGLVEPVVWRETASAALFRTPGICTIRNLYRSVFSFRLRSLPLGIFSKDRSLNIFRSGLWSTAMMKSLQPRTKNRALSRASATARASPSTRG